MTTVANRSDTPNPAMTPQLQAGSRRRGVSEPER